MVKRIQPTTLLNKKQNQDPIVMVTVYDAPFATLLDNCDIDILFIGDSLGNTVQGHSSTIPVTIDHMIYHTQLVARGSQKGMVLADMPFMSYRVSQEAAKLNAGRLVQEGGAQAVKIEVNAHDIPILKAIRDMDIPVMGHIGLTPQSVLQLGGYSVQGKNEEEAKHLLELAKAVEQAGAFALVLEMIPSELAKHITQSISIPTIGIGAGPHCDGQVLVLHDVLGLRPSKAKFVKSYCNLDEIASKAITQFKQDVQTGSFPDTEHSYH